MLRSPVLDPQYNNRLPRGGPCQPDPTGRARRLPPVPKEPSRWNPRWGSGGSDSKSRHPNRRAAGLVPAHPPGAGANPACRNQDSPTTRLKGAANEGSLSGVAAPDATCRVDTSSAKSCYNDGAAVIFGGPCQAPPMATSILIQDSLEIPFVRSLAEFRVWACSDAYPQQGRIDYLAGRIEVDTSPEDLYCHGTLKTRLVIVLGQIIDAGDLGELFSDKTRVSSPQADLSAEPDVLFVSYDALEQGRVRRVPKATGEPERYVELEGAPDLVVEIVSDDSVGKDTQRLPVAYYQAAIPEFWLLDARGGRLDFQIHTRGSAAYKPVAPDADGFRHSALFARSFRLSRRKGRAGGWQYGLEQKLDP